MEENKNIDPEQPAENIPEVEHSEIPPSSGKIISSEQKPLPKTEEQLSTLNLQPSDMEVHHHGHVHEKKKWKEYLFQFLMLFLDNAQYDNKQCMIGLIIIK